MGSILREYTRNGAQPVRSLRRGPELPVGRQRRARQVGQATFAVPEQEPHFTVCGNLPFPAQVPQPIRPCVQLPQASLPAPEQCLHWILSSTFLPMPTSAMSPVPLHFAQLIAPDPAQTPQRSAPVPAQVPQFA